MEQYENSIQHVCSMKESVQCRQLVTSQRAMREIIGVLSPFLIEFVRSAEVFYDGGMRKRAMIVITIRRVDLLMFCLT